MTAPQTGFEQSGTWTTREDGDNLLVQIASETDAVVTEAGRTVQDRPILRIDLGNPSGPTMLIVGLQHGGEPAGREGALQFIRDLAYSEDAGVLSYLGNHRITMIPTVNADQILASRNNANDVNLNRDWWALTQPETQAVHGAIRDVQPNLIVDAHEHSSAESGWLAYANGMPGTHPAVAALATDLQQAGTEAVQAASFATGNYPMSALMWAGLSTTSGAAHTVGILSETRIADDPHDRVAIHLLTMAAFRGWHAAHTAELAAARAASVANALNSRAPTPYMTREYIGAGDIATAKVRGYRLLESFPAQLATEHGIVVDDDYVAIRQPARLAIATLCDPGSAAPVVMTEPVGWFGAPRSAVAQVGGVRCAVIGAWYQHGAERRPVRLPGIEA